MKVAVSLDLSTYAGMKAAIQARFGSLDAAADHCGCHINTVYNFCKGRGGSIRSQIHKKLGITSAKHSAKGGWR